jgi:hypothetical protein
MVQTDGYVLIPNHLQVCRPCAVMHTSGRVENENGGVLSRTAVPSVADHRFFVTNIIAICWQSSC